MLYYVKNASGNVSDVTEEMYHRLKGKDEYEAWTEDPYESLPQEVTDNPPKSTDYTVKEFKDLTEGMDAGEIEAMIPEDEDRISIIRLVE